MRHLLNLAVISSMLLVLSCKKDKIKDQDSPEISYVVKTVDFVTELPIPGVNVTATVLKSHDNGSLLPGIWDETAFISKTDAEGIIRFTGNDSYNLTFSKEGYLTRKIPAGHLGPIQKLIPGANIQVIIRNRGVYPGISGNITISTWSDLQINGISNMVSSYPEASDSHIIDATNDTLTNTVFLNCVAELPNYLKFSFKIGGQAEEKIYQNIIVSRNTITTVEFDY